MARLLTILALSLALLATGCSNTRMGYNFADWWASWQVRKYVSLDRSQRQLLRQHLNSLHAWHRETQLPIYADFMEQSLDLLERNEALTESDLQALIDEALALWQVLMERAIAPTTELLAGLSDRQAQELVNNIREAQKDWLEDDDDRTPAERVTEQTERWLGEVTDSQREWIDRWGEHFTPGTEHRRDSQARWLQQLEQVLAKRQDATALEQGVTKLLVEDDWQYSEDYREQVDENRKRSLALMVRILNARTDAQEAHLRERVEDYIADFRRLAD